MVSTGAAKASRPVQLRFGARPALVDDLDVVVEDGSDDGHHVGLDDAGPDILRPSHADVEDALEGQVPLPHVHHVLAPAFLEYAYQTLNAAIDGENVPYAGRGCGEIGEVVERVDEGEGRGAVEGAAVVEGGGDADRRLVGIRDAEVDLAHDGCCSEPWVMGWTLESGLVSHVVGSKHAVGDAGRG